MQVKAGLLSICLIVLVQIGAMAQKGGMDRIFLLGSTETNYEQLTTTYSQSMLEAAQMDITKAFEHWLGMLQEIDKYADRINFDVKGVKVWMHVFFNEQGGIDKLGYLLRPDSRYVDETEIQAFFAGFVKEYTFPLKSDRKYNHYTGATFPTLSERADK